MEKLKCGRPGCEQQYVESENVEGSCHFHTGGPVFHEGQKGWSCCPPRVLTFDEFLTIPGCSTGKHTPHKETVKIQLSQEQLQVLLLFFLQLEKNNF